MKNPLAHVRGADRVGQPLFDHLTNVGQLAAHFARNIGLERTGLAMGLLHDFGKYSQDFQNYLLSATGLLDQDNDGYVDSAALKGSIDHSSAGAQYLWQILGRKNTIALAQCMALGIMSHHSGLIDCLAPKGTLTFNIRLHKDDAASHLSECSANADAALLTALDEVLTQDTLRELHACLAKIHQDFQQRAPQSHDPTERADHENACAFTTGLVARFLLSCVIDADRIDSASFEDPAYANLRASLPRRPWPRLITRLEQHLASLPQESALNALRRDIAAHCRARAADPQGLFTLTVPTGGGKTLASLRFALHHAQAHGCDRIVYIIPYTSIIDQNAQVVRHILEGPDSGEVPGSIVLEHHSNLQSERASWQGSMLDDNWDAPIVFTTLVHFLDSLFGKGTSSTRRLHALSNAVLIFDEIHTLPLRCVHLFCLALQFLTRVAGSSALLCTATQPLLGALRYPFKGQLTLPPGCELMPDVAQLFADLQRVRFINHCAAPMDIPAITALALEEVSTTGSCLIVCNTKKIAQDVYQACSKAQKLQVLHLSTNMCPAHRLHVLAQAHELLRAGKACLCVSTQLIECGVDISFGSVIRFAAGLDSILQAAGRCNRHGHNASGRVHIVTMPPGSENLASLPDILRGRTYFLDAILHNCAAQLAANGNDLTQPDIMHSYFERAFSQRADEMAYPIQDAVRDDSLLNLLGTNRHNTVQSPAGFMRQSFATASSLFAVIDAPTRGIIVPYGDEGKELIAALHSHAFLWEKRILLQQAQRYTVAVYPQLLNSLFAQGALYPVKDTDILCLQAGFYTQTTGLCAESQAATILEPM